MSRIRELALNLLARREHSQLELKRKLLAKGFLLSEVEVLLASLAEEGLQSDVRYTETYVNHRVNMGFGPYRILLELQARGIAKSLAQQYLSKDDEFWEAALASAWQKKYHNQKTTDSKTVAKQIRFLVQRGFGQDQVIRNIRFIAD